ncbi:hypothetical protein [Roseospira navarrensis]|uniref:Uncharacterized protein n=1 Tax=Roseospira navarrensis TaxID=140058 RepID=A0A7X2D5R8_9PROT|nr:hypothetical protein [Roseospira navarrensis]MQX37525.1 hypothetical protein [Roseospira navarrensis]
MLNDRTIDQELGNRIGDLLFEAIRLQDSARRSGDTETSERIAAFIAAVSAAESACLRTDESGGALMMSRLDESRVH